MDSTDNTSTTQIKEQEIISGVKVKGTPEYAIVVVDLLLGPTKVKEFTSTESDCFEQAVRWAQAIYETYLRCSRSYALRHC